MTSAPRGDTGLADPGLAQALTRHLEGPRAATRAQVLAALAEARVFAAIVAVSTAEHVDVGTGLRAESTAEMRLITLAGSTGPALPVFLDVPAVTGFAEGARPVPFRGPDACRAALEQSAVALVLDPAGARVVVAHDELAELAAGRLPVPGTRVSARATDAALTTPSAVDPALLDALARALRGEPVRAARLLDGPDGPVLGIVPDRLLDAPALAALAARLAPRLDGPLDLSVVPPSGPGHPVRLRRRLLRRRR